MAGPSNIYTMRPVIPQSRADVAGRITISSIPPGVTEAQLVANLRHHGDAKVHMFVPGCEYTPGWAWVSFPTNAEVQRVLESAHGKAMARGERVNTKVQAVSIASILVPQRNKKECKLHKGADDNSEGEPTNSSCSDPAYSDSAPGEGSDGAEEI